MVREHLTSVRLRGIRIGDASHPGLRARTVPTEADSSIPTVMDLTVIDTESEGDSVDDDGAFAELHDGMHDAEPVENPIPRGRRLVLVGGGQSQHVQNRILITVFQRILVKRKPRVCLGQSHMVKFLWKYCPSLSPAGVRLVLLSEISMSGIKRRYSRADRAHVMKTVPSFLRGGFRPALRIALDGTS